MKLNVSFKKYNSKLVLFILLVIPVFNLNASCNLFINGERHDCDGVVKSHDFNNSIPISSQRIESGIMGGAVIKTGGSLHLNGISNGDITVYEGGFLVVIGTVNGTVKNQGGTIQINGIVSNVFVKSGETMITGTVLNVSEGPGIVYKEGAIINGVEKK